MGLHIHLPNDLEPVRQLARAGKLAGLTIINDTGFANEMVGLVPYVVLRMVSSDHDNPTQDYQHYGADPRVIVQCGNEANVLHDTDHWLKQMHDADADGRKVIIFNDSVGATEDAAWLERRPALEYARDHQHFIGLHAYGDVTKGGKIYCPMTDMSGWRWFGGRWQHLFGLMPDVQPNLILSECGAGGFQRNCGDAETWLKDVQTMNNIARIYPFLKSFNWWDFTRKGIGFDDDIINDWVHVL